MRFFYRLLIIAFLFGVATLAFVTFANAATTVTPVFGGGTGWGNITANRLLLGNGANALATTSAGTNGQILELANGVPTFLTASSSGSGTVTSVTCNGGLSGGTFTTSGTCAFNLGNSNWWTAIQNFTNASSSQLTASSSVYLTNTTGAILSTNAGGLVQNYAGTSCTNQFVRSLNGAGAATCNTVSLTADITGTLGVANGGTGWASINSGNVLFGNAGSALATSSSITFSTTGGTLLTTTNASTTNFTVGTYASLATTTFTAGILSNASQPATSSAITLDWGQTPPQIEYRIGTAALSIGFIDGTTSPYWGSRKLVWVCNGAATAGSLTWLGVEWIGAAPTQTTTANQCDVYSFDITRASSTNAYKVAGTAGTGFQ
jgi:hypothetical protein